MKRLQPLWLALVLLSTLPVARLIATPVAPATQGRSVVWYPVVGLLLGALVATLAWLLAGVDARLGAALTLSLWIALTGALHLDGLADCVDAWFAGHGDPGRTLTVMKDAAAGPMAVTALILVCLLKFAALVALWPRAPIVLPVALVLARCAAAAVMMITRYRRDQGLASALDAHMPRAWVAGVVAVALLASIAWLGPLRGVFLIAVAAVVAWGWRGLWRRRIGGYTGDVIGGLIECVEAAVLVAAALLA